MLQSVSGQELRLHLTDHQEIDDDFPRLARDIIHVDARTEILADLGQKRQGIQIGAPMRNIAPCVSCHGGSEQKVTAPLLDGEPASYIRDQLLAFADGSRRNDILGQMRNIARQMTPEEIEIVARYYSRR
jgi:cytochrome c553